MEDFFQFKLSDGTLDAIVAKGYEHPSPIQTLSIPPLLEGRDLIAQAQTGTGKTAAFGIPMIERFRDVERGGVVSLTLVPTRELAIQVAEELQELAKGSGLRVVAVYGGVGIGRQIDALERTGTILLVATPGRLLDHMQQRTVRLDRVETLILDEADRMLDMGFLRDVERILKAVPDKRQTALFSATVPDEIRRLSKRYLHAPESVRAETGPTATERAEQFQLAVEKPAKHGALLALLHHETPPRAIVFTRTKHLAKRLADRLRKDGWSAVALQGNMTQGQRERAMGAFRGGEARILVATDVASRGLDVADVSHVVNYDLPDTPEAYVHRIGRTARMGAGGRAFTFVQSDERRDLSTIERIGGVRISGYDLDLRNVPGNGPDPVVPKLPPQGRPAPRRSEGGENGRSNGGRPRNGRRGGRSRSSGGHGGGGPAHDGPRRARPAGRSRRGSGPRGHSGGGSGGQGRSS